MGLLDYLRALNPSESFNRGKSTYKSLGEPDAGDVDYRRSTGKFGDIPKEDIGLVDRIAEGRRDAGENIPATYIKNLLSTPYELTKAFAMHGSPVQRDIGNKTYNLAGKLLGDPSTYTIDDTTSEANLAAPLAYGYGSLLGLKDRFKRR